MMFEQCSALPHSHRLCEVVLSKPCHGTGGITSGPILSEFMCACACVCVCGCIQQKTLAKQFAPHVSKNIRPWVEALLPFRSPYVLIPLEVVVWSIQYNPIGFHPHYIMIWPEKKCQPRIKWRLELIIWLFDDCNYILSSIIYRTIYNIPYIIHHIIIYYIHTSYPQSRLHKP